MRVVVRTTARALVDEEWEIEVTPEQAAALKAEPYTFEDLMAEETASVIRVDDVQVYNEEDREVTEVLDKEDE